jgi:hypothetical protein
MYASLHDFTIASYRLIFCYIQFEILPLQRTLQAIFKVGIWLHLFSYKKLKRLWGCVNDVAGIMKYGSFVLEPGQL